MPTSNTAANRPKQIVHPPAPPPSRKEIAASALIVVLAMIACAAINLVRTDHLTSDQFSIGALVQKIANPELFSRDPTYGDIEKFSYYLPWYQSLLAWLVESSGSVGMAYWWLMVACSVVMLAGFWIFFLAMRVRPVWAAWGAILASLPRLAPAEEITGAMVMQTALPRTIFSMAIPFILLLFFRSRGRGLLCILAFLLVGLAGNAHPQSALFMTLILGLLLLIRHRGRLLGWLTGAGGGVAAVVGILPFVLTFALPEEKPTTTLTVSPYTVSGIIAKAEPPKQILIFLACIVPLFCAVWLAKRSARGNKSNTAAGLATIGALIATAVALCGGAISSLALISNHKSLLAMMHWQRAMRIIPPLLLAAVVLWLGCGVRRGGLFRKHLAAAILTLIPVVASIGAMEYIYLLRHAPQKELARIAKQTTSIDALFITNPKGGEAFRVWAERSILIAKVDLHFLKKVGLKKLGKKWGKDMIRSIKKGYNERKIKHVVKIAREQGVDYIALTEQQWPKNNLQGADGIYKVPPTPPAQSGPASRPPGEPMNNPLKNK